MLRIIPVVLLASISLLASTINMNSIINNAAKENKQVFLFLHTTYCGYCEKMIEFTLDDPHIQKIISKNFILVDINVKKEGTVLFKEFQGSYKEFAKYLGYNFYPSSLFFNSNKEIALAQRGYVEEPFFAKTLENAYFMYE